MYRIGIDFQVKGVQLRLNLIDLLMECNITIIENHVLNAFIEEILYNSYLLKVGNHNDN